jgi:hypothetical protein
MGHAHICAYQVVVKSSAMSPYQVVVKSSAMSPYHDISQYPKWKLTFSIISGEFSMWRTSKNVDKLSKKTQRIVPGVDKSSNFSLSNLKGRGRYCLLELKRVSCCKRSWDFQSQVSRNKKIVWPYCLPLFLWSPTWLSIFQLY